jgi:hypothetical protein
MTGPTANHDLRSGTGLERARPLFRLGLQCFFHRSLLLGAPEGEFQMMTTGEIHTMAERTTIDLTALAIELADTPCSPINYETPRSVSLTLLSRAPMSYAVLCVANC